MVRPMPADSTSPVMRQYLDAKAEHPDCLLFFRMGDFYELFFEDAVTAAGALNITLTQRGQHGGDPIPMAGVPFHAYDSYLTRLIRQGFKVAIAEQLETPEEAKKRRGKPLVARGVVRVVTPGTLTEDTLLEPRAANWLACLIRNRNGFALAAADISTGQVGIETIAAVDLGGALARLEPSELLLPDALLSDQTLEEILAGHTLSPMPSARFDPDSGRRHLEKIYGVGTLSPFGIEDKSEIAALGALIEYVDRTQQGVMPRLDTPRRSTQDGHMAIDAATRRNLELTRTLAGDRKGSLLAAIDRTVTGAGARLLAQHLAAPLTDRETLEHRMDLADALKRETGVRDGLRSALAKCPDLERSLSRLSVGRGGPRDLAAIRDGLAAAESIRGLLRPIASDETSLITRLRKKLGRHGARVVRLADALAPDLPLLARDGGFIASGFLARLDELRTMRDEGKRLIAGLQGRYVSESEINTLKIKHNAVLGYFVEVTPTHADRLAVAPLNETFIHRQTLSTAVRFTTVELTDLEKEMSQAGERAKAVELELFETLRQEVLEEAEAIAGAAQALAHLDVGGGHADLALAWNWTRANLTDGTDFVIRKGRHPVVEALLPAEMPFVPNDSDLSENRRLWLLTGPNMAGKSTFLRQNALIAILAQIGAYVPAESATLGIIDRVFSRVGAADDLARGQSTFMVEMVETAGILHQASPKSLVILDEIGRGTATFDGLSLAWAVVEHLHDRIGCRGLFATHYHELTRLEDRLDHLACHTVKVAEWEDRIVFLHEVIPGVAGRSYGIHVATLAGLPKSVVRRAESVLSRLERDDKAAERLDTLPLFAMAPSDPEPEPSPMDPIGTELRAVLADTDPDGLTPRAALDLVYRLVSQARGE